MFFATAFRLLVAPTSFTLGAFASLTTTCFRAVDAAVVAWQTCGQNHPTEGAVKGTVRCFQRSVATKAGQTTLVSGKLDMLASSGHQEVRVTARTSSFCVPGMFNNLEVKVHSQSDDDEV